LATHSANASWIAGQTATNSDSGYKQHLVPAIKAESRVGQGAASACTTTISVEFVAKPNESHSVHGLLLAAISGTLQGVAGFAGCAVMVSNLEERLVTILTFWQGDLNAGAAATNSGWVCKLMERYVDHRLRIQTMRTHLAMAAPKTDSSERNEQHLHVS
jgi:hypothetical protein